MWQHIINVLNFIFHGFDSSKFQNVILGAVTILIPFAIFSFSVRNKRRFEIVLLNSEVLKPKKLFWCTISGTVIFAFFSDAKSPLVANSIAICFIVVIVYIYWGAFKTIVQYAEGDRDKVELSFLKKLHFIQSATPRKNAQTKQRMHLAWSYLLPAKKAAYHEEKLTTKFITHIDSAITCHEYNAAIELAKIYTQNITQRIPELCVRHILPKVFVWSQDVWDAHTLSMTKKDINKQNKYIHEPFYFSGVFFVAITNAVFKHTNTSIAHNFFDAFTDYINSSKRKYHQDMQTYDKYIRSAFAYFCPIFFAETEQRYLFDAVWDAFPSEWQITYANRDSDTAHLMLREFMKHAKYRLFSTAEEVKQSTGLTAIVQHLFPYVHAHLFTAFLMLYCAYGVEDALQQRANFSLKPLMISSGGPWPPEGTDGMEDAEVLHAAMEAAESAGRHRAAQQEKEQEKETVRVIINFFDDWHSLAWHSDINQTEVEEWNNGSEEQRKTIERKIQCRKVKKIQTEATSEAIKEICKRSPLKAFYQEQIVRLTKLLIKELRT